MRNANKISRNVYIMKVPDRVTLSDEVRRRGIGNVQDNEVFIPYVTQKSRIPRKRHAFKVSIRFKITAYFRWIEGITGDINDNYYANLIRIAVLTDIKVPISRNCHSFNIITLPSLIGTC